MRTAGSLAMGVVTIALFLFLPVAHGLGSMREPGAWSDGVSRCKPGKAKVLAAGQKARVFVLTRTIHSGPRDLTREDVFACLMSTEQLWLLNRVEVPAHSAETVDTTAIGLHAPWVAYPVVLHGVDTSVLRIRTLNLHTGYSFDCEIGGTRAPNRGPSVRSLLLRRNGVAAFIADANGGYLTQDKTVGQVGVGARPVREVAACRPSVRTIFDNAEGIDPTSLALRGARLTWLDAGVMRSASLD